MSLGITPVSSNIEHFDEFLKILDAIKAEEWVGAEVNILTTEVIESVLKLRNIYKISKLERLARTVELGCRYDLFEDTKEIFSSGSESTGSGLVEEFLALIGDNKDELISSVSWAKYLEADLQPVACETIFDSILSKGYTDQYQIVLPLLQIVKNLPIGVLDNIRPQLEEHSRVIINRLVEAIKQKDYTSFDNADRVFDFYMPAIVSKFNICDVESVLLLIEYNHHNEKARDISLALVNNLFKALDENLLLDSEQALHLWAHAKSVKYLEEAFDVDLPELFLDTVKQLKKYKNKYVIHYQCYVEDEDRQKIKNMHCRNPDLYHIVKKFITWYYNGSAERTRNLLSAAKSNQERVNELYSDHVHTILHNLRTAMEKNEDLGKFEAFLLYNVFHQQRTYCDMPAVCANLFSSSKQLRLVNKFFNAPLCMHQGRVFCCNSHDQFCTISVDPDTALTTISLLSGDTCLQLDSSGVDGDEVKVTENGTKWMIKVFDDDHVNIFDGNGNFMTTEGKLGRVCLKKENNTEMQQWKIL